jgi:tetratricopeptide (TPR) repeat protein
VAFQSSLTRYKEVLGRYEAPLHVQAAIGAAFWKLLCNAPLSVELTLLLACSTMKQQQFALLARFLERSPLSGETAALALVHARALAYAGFYSRSVEVAHSFTLPQEDHGQSSIKALRAFCDQLMQLRACREKADECLKLDQFDKAASGYAECLALVDPSDRKQVAALLFGHGNALLGLEQVPAAIDALRKSLKLDPANKIASIRLQTARLQLETEQIKRELSRHR